MAEELSPEEKMTDDDALKYARRRKVDAIRSVDVDFWDWAIRKATAGRPVTLPHGPRPVRNRAEYMKKWRAKRAAEFRELQAREPSA